jgi:hypothetical protein
MATEREDGDDNGNKIKIGNYDVLLQELSNRTPRIASEPATHVGNNRLEVLLLMSRSEYKERMAAGEATFPVIENVIEIVTKQCVPPGRFLLPAGKEDVDKPHHERAWLVVSLERVEKFIGLALLDGKEAGLGNLPGFSKEGSESAPKDDDESTKKRGRRSSLLRRSVSESIVRLAAKNEADGKKSGADGKKKGNHRSSSLWSIRKEKSQTKVTQTEDLDVLLNFEQTSLLPNHVGNNRLKVLLNIHKEKYENSTIEEQTSSLQEWIRTVTQFWGGRFLRQLEDSLGGFEHLDTNQAELALHSVISEISQSSDDILSLSAVGKSASLPILGNVPPAAGSDVQDMRSAAVQSLQKRKKRQGLASRLRNLAAATLTRTTSHSARAQSKPESGGLDRSSSAPTASRYNSGANSLPTSPTPPDTKDPNSLRNSGRAKRSSSITLPRFLTGRASLRRSRELAEAGALQELKETLEVDEPEEGPEAFGEFDTVSNGRT